MKTIYVFNTVDSPLNIGGMQRPYVNFRIVLESAYSLNDRVFFNNIGTILLYAVIGTILNCFLIGTTLLCIHYLTTV